MRSRERRVKQMEEEEKPHKVERKLSGLQVCGLGNLNILRRMHLHSDILLKVILENWSLKSAPFFTVFKMTGRCGSL